MQLNLNEDKMSLKLYKCLNKNCLTILKKCKVSKECVDRESNPEVYFLFSKKVLFFILYFFEKTKIFQSVLNSQIYLCYYVIKIRLSKFQNDCLKTVGVDRFLMK